MAVTPVNIARVSQNMKAFNLLSTIRSSQVGLFRVQNQLATGLKFLTPSQDPTGAAKTLALEAAMERLDQLQINVRDANATLLSGESAMQDAIDLILEASVIASENVNDTVDAAARKAAAILIDGIVDQVITIGNRRHLGTYLFSGHRNDQPPFESTAGGVLYQGDAGRRQTIVGLDLAQESFTISGMEFFQAVSTGVQGYRDLDPAITLETRISDLRGTTGNGIRLGQISVTADSEQVLIDLTGAATVGDLVDRLNAELPASLEASLSATGIQIGPSGVAGLGSFMIEDVGAGQAARDLGIYTQTAGSATTGADLDPVITLRTRLSDLNAAAGIDLSGGITIRNGNHSATISFAGVTTVEEALNLINETGLGVQAEISADGRSINLLNRVAGVSMTIEENGGVAADSLGIRSTYGGTLLSELHDGRGVSTLEGDDIRIITAGGTSIDIDVDGLRTIQDVIDAFNAAGGGAISASLAANGNGITIIDNTVGGGTISINRINISPALDGLGLAVSAAGNTLVGDDPNPQRVDSAFTALIELREALELNDTRTITLAAQRLEGALTDMQEVQGRAASRARAMEERAVRFDDTISATRVLLSDVRDVDIADAVVRFQQLENALRANLATASRILNLSLIDFLR